MSNQLDDFFKNKLQQRSFDYDESAWEEARLLIENEEKRKRRRGWILSFAGLFLLSVVGLTAYQFGKGSTALPHTPNIPIDLQQNELKIQAQKSIAAQAPSLETANDNVTIEAGSTVVTRNEPAQTAYQSKLERQRKIENLEANSKASNPITNTKSNFVEALGVDTDISILSSSEPITTYSNPTYVAPATPKPSNASSKTTIATNVLSRIPYLTTSNIGTGEKEADLTDLLPELIQTPDGLPDMNLASNWTFGIRGGASLIPFDFTDFEGGAFISYHLNRNLSLSFQPHYTIQQLQGESSANSNILEYGFGLRTSAYSLQAESIRSLHAPIMISYAFGNGKFDLTDEVSNRFMKNKISFGVSYVYLDGVAGSILVKEDANAQSVYQEGWLDSDNFNRNNAELIVGYERFFSDRISIGFMARYRMQDQFSDSFYDQNSSVKTPSPFYFGLQSYFKLF